MRRGFAALLGLGLAAALAAPAAAAALVMFETEGCPWCAAWHRDVGQHYAASDHAKVLPLRRLDMRAPRPDDLAGLADIRYSPTFVVMACGREVERILGYSGAGNFWDSLDVALTKVKRLAGPGGDAC